MNSIILCLETEWMLEITISFYIKIRLMPDYFPKLFQSYSPLSSKWTLFCLNNDFLMVFPIMLLTVIASIKIISIEIMNLSTDESMNENKASSFLKKKAEKKIIIRTIYSDSFQRCSDVLSLNTVM